jgi:large subunit ribosomal protein L30
MASILMARSISRGLLSAPRTIISRAATTQASSSASASTTELPADIPNTHFKITLRRSAISLGDKIKETLVSLGIHRRFQTVYHRHGPEVAGKILRVKELVEVENVPEHMVRTKQQMRQERKATRGYKVIGRRDGDFQSQT